MQPLALELENELLPASSEIAVCSVSRDEVESTETGRRGPRRLWNPHRLRRCLNHATDFEGISDRRCRWIEHRPGDERLEEVAMDVEILEDHLLEQRLS
jgi:hypothetical protein